MADVGRDLLDTLYYGENSEILQRFISDETVDLIYLDPPFNKNKAYSLIFRDESGHTSDAQLATFEDYWHWGPTPARHYDYLTNSVEHQGRVPPGVADLMGALYSSIRPSPMLAYIVEMATRLVELRRVLKPTGSLYLHCDPTASHYLKLLLDAIFGPAQFQNEIIWRRTTPKGNITRRAARNHDVLLHYVAEAGNATWNPQYLAADPERTAQKYNQRDESGRAYSLTSLLSPNPNRPNLVYEFHGVTRTWRWTRERMEEADRQGLIIVPRGGRGVPRFKRYLDEQEGIPLDDVWVDIPAVNAMARERRHYPTQKPVRLLERIIAASSHPGDVVLDPFCGCGTTIEAARNLGRRWIGIDNSNFAVLVIQERLRQRGTEVAIFDWPTEIDGVRRMVEAPGGRHRFEAWALARLGAHPSIRTGHKGADQGIDGRIVFTTRTGRTQAILVSVKSGNVSSRDVRDLKGTVQREGVVGLLFTLREPTPAMVKEASTAGFYRADDGERYPRIVLHTVRELFAGRMPILPSRHGVQQVAWEGLPTAARAVRVHPMKRAASETRTPGPVIPLSGEESDRRREAYAHRAAEERHDEEAASPAEPRSRMPSRRDR